jgi:hypothetical protein
MLSVAIARWRGAGRIAIVSLLGIAMLIFIFQMGYDVGEGYVNGTVPTHVLNDNVYGRLILLRHEIFCLVGVNLRAQQGHRGRARASATISR